MPKIYQKIETLVRDFERLDQHLKDSVPITAKTSKTLKEKRSKSHQALRRLREGIDQPEVVFAVSGTTSAGKSTIVNMLLGDQVMPYAVQEMSAGTVEIIHHNTNRSLTIMMTEGATWETGHFSNLDADAIRSRLKGIMTQYRTEAKTNRSMKPPEFRVEWQCSLANDLEKFGLPPETKIKILDLPGLKFIGDEQNAQVIREKAKKAFCIIAYNSLETDEKKQKDLLRQVTQQVKSLGGGPARMMFVLNKIDAFLKDENPEESKNHFQEQTLEAIRTSLYNELPEYKDDIDKISLLVLSSEPALLAIQAKNGNKKALQKMIDSEYRVLIKDILKELKIWDLDDLSAKKIEILVQAMLTNTHHGAFYKTFKEQIQTHLPALILPALVQGVIHPIQNGCSLKLGHVDAGGGDFNGS